MHRQSSHRTWNILIMRLAIAMGKQFFAFKVNDLSLIALETI